VADLDGGDWFKAFAVAGPLFASSLAVSYDVGFFYGAGIGFFTFFSLTEHIVFALQAIPFALVPAFTIVGLIAVTWWGYHKIVTDSRDAVEKARQMSPEERETFLAKLKRQVRRNNLIDPFVQGALFVGALWLFIRHSYTGAFLVLVSQVIAKMVYPIDRWDSKNFRYVIALFCVTAGWATAFSLGYERAEAILSSTAPTDKIFVEGKELSARLIRGGERGVLFKSFGTGKPSFVRWEKITRIDAL
jgi:hypothetical protein